MVDLIQDLNGNHVIQKCLNHLTPDDAQVRYFAEVAAPIHANSISSSLTVLEIIVLWLEPIVMAAAFCNGVLIMLLVIRKLN